MFSNSKKSEIDLRGGGVSIFQISLKFKKSLKYPIAYLGKSPQFSRILIMTAPLRLGKLNELEQISYDS